ncbi:beta propeller repeat protein [Paenibacillus xanthanilyticus]|uniref:Uncharacterized protein n=1 Tax=Paenibacillus xanthanilyticus TaxID=1783531 RepID=A0ABV8JY23_9BACL
MLPNFNRSWQPQSRPLHFSSVKVQGDRSLVAASPGKGVYHRKEHGEWQRMSDGLPSESMVHRLQTMDRRLYACTSKGLYQLQDNRWVNGDLEQACYQYKEEWGSAFAATDDGLLYRNGGEWRQSAYKRMIVYDFLFTPEYLYIGLESGIGMYDRMTDQWAGFPLGSGVTSLAADRTRLIGATDSGELVMSTGRGGFERIRFGDMFVFSVVSRLPHVYVCTDKGLFRVGRLGGRLTLFSLKPGLPVTDVDWLGSDLYMATLSKGIQTMRA